MRFHDTTPGAFSIESRVASAQSGGAFVMAAASRIYSDYTGLNTTENADVPGWGGVKSLGWMSLAQHLDSLASMADKTLIWLIKR